MAKKIPDLTHPGYPRLAMIMSKEEHSFSYDAIAGTGANKYQIMIGLIKDAQFFLSRISRMTMSKKVFLYESVVGKLAGKIIRNSRIG